MNKITHEAGCLGQNLPQRGAVPAKSLILTLLRQQAPWLSASVARATLAQEAATGRNGVFGFAGFRKDAPRLAAGYFTLWLSILLISPVFAGDNGNTEQQPGDNEARFEATAGRLSLSGEQREKIKTLRQAQRQQMEALLQQLRAKREQIKSELNNPSATRESIAPLVAEIKNIQSQMVDLRINNIFAIKEMLNPEQFNKLQQFQQQRTGEMKERRRSWLEKRRGNMENKEEINQEE